MKAQQVQAKEVLEQALTEERQRGQVTAMYMIANSIQFSEMKNKGSVTKFNIHRLSYM